MNPLVIMYVVVCGGGRVVFNRKSRAGRGVFADRWARGGVASLEVLAMRPIQVYMHHRHAGGQAASHDAVGVCCPFPVPECVFA